MGRRVALTPPAVVFAAIAAVIAVLVSVTVVPVGVAPAHAARPHPGSQPRSHPGSPQAAHRAHTVAVDSPPSARAAAGKVHVVTYKGYGVNVRRSSHQLHRLNATSAKFRKAVTHALNAIWRDGGSRPKCAKAPLLTVKRWRSDGWARIPNIGSFAPCPTGGHWEIWRARHGKWRTVLGGQEDPQCRQLRRKHVPKNIWTMCYNAAGDLVRYQGP